MRKVLLFFVIVPLLLVLGACGSSQKKDVILATTTSTQDTGLLDVLVPLFKNEAGYNVKPVAVGSGQALAMGEKGEADVLLVHSPAAEMKVMDSGAAVDRRLVMHNFFAIVGPASDPAGIKGGKDAAAALKKIAGAKALWVSRADKSGTDAMEKSLWAKAGVTPAGSWYQETGQGMGATLNVTSEKGGYTLTDRGTYLSLKKNLGLQVLVEGDPALLNVYHVMRVNPEKFPKVNSAGAKAFADFMVSKKTQDIIKAYGVDKYGEALFTVDAGKKEEELSR